MYGSDYPFNIGDMERCLQRVNNLSTSKRNKVRGDNAVRLFSL
jgi:predicted TIM-barrel fold metal-dependent hydrolase